MQLTEHKTHSQARQLRAQCEIVQQIMEQTEPLQMLDDVLDKLMDQTGLDAVWVVFSDDRQEEEEHHLICRGLSDELANRLEEGTCVWRPATGPGDEPQPWESCWEKHAGAFAAEGLQNVSFQSIQSEGIPVGVLVGAARGGPAMAESVEILLESVALCLGERVMRMRQEAALRNSRHNLDCLLATMDDLIFIVDGDGRIVFSNAADTEFLKTGGTGLVGAAVEDFLPGIHPHVTKVDHIAETTLGLHCFLDERMELTAGPDKRAPVEVRAYQGRWDDRNVSYLVCCDISRKLEMEQERDRLVKAIVQSHDSIIITDAEGRVSYVNPAFSRLTGYSTREVMGETPAILKSGVHDEAFYKEMWETLLEGREWAGRMVNRRKNGELYTELATISPLRDEQDVTTHFVAVKRDITQETVLEERLQQSEKLATIANLTGGLAHDFNNILYALLGFVQLAQDDLEADSPANESLAEVVKAGERAQSLVQRMLSLGHKTSDGAEQIRLTDFVARNLDLVKAGLPGNISVLSDLNPDIDPIQAVQSQMQQVITNICANSADAMQPSGGTLMIRVDQCIHKGNRACTGRDLPEGNWVRLEFTDTGRGIAPEDLDRIFEPYFTIGNWEDGAGLGLATVQGIIVGLGGHIHVTSEEGRGSVFTCFLPAVPVPASPSQGEESAPPGTFPNARILVVDDEPMIVDVVVKTLARNGFNASGCFDGESALEMVRSASTPFDLVITDQTMPGITGSELITKLSSLETELPIILMSGSSSLPLDNGSGQPGVACILAKPVRAEQLVEKVQSVLRTAAIS